MKQLLNEDNLFYKFQKGSFLIVVISNNYRKPIFRVNRIRCIILFRKLNVRLERAEKKFMHIVKSDFCRLMKL